MPVVVICKCERPVLEDRASCNFFLESRSASTERRPRVQFAGEGCKCRYIRYALIEPVVLNNFQKTSEVRICVGGSLSCRSVRAFFAVGKGEYITGFRARQVLTEQGFSAT